MGCSAFVSSICSISGSSCMFLIPNSKSCAEMFGEGPDAQVNKCEDCKFFYTEDGKRCCTQEAFSWKENELVKSKYIEDGVVCCGGWEGK